eukprot:12328537-Alexandrium_andersonii.AAC.1
MRHWAPVPPATLAGARAATPRTGPWRASWRTRPRCTRRSSLGVPAKPGQTALGSGTPFGSTGSH